MIPVNQKKIQVIAQIAEQIVNQQTVEELNALYAQIGVMYTNAELAAEIAVKMMLRIVGVQVETRAVSPVDYLVTQAETVYHANYAG